MCAVFKHLITCLHGDLACSEVLRFPAGGFKAKASTPTFSLALHVNGFNYTERKIFIRMSVVCLNASLLIHMLWAAGLAFEVLRGPLTQGCKVRLLQG